MSFCRIDDRPIRTHEPVIEPDALIIQDPTLLHQADLFAGLGHDGDMLVNSTRDFGASGAGPLEQPHRPAPHAAGQRGRPAAAHGYPAGPHRAPAGYAS